MVFSVFSVLLWLKSKMIRTDSPGEWIDAAPVADTFDPDSTRSRSPVMDDKQLLFAYGTLRSEQVQRETYGRTLQGRKDGLPQYRLGRLRISDPDVLAKSGQEYHPIAVKTGSPNDLVEGTVFEITQAELEQADMYEVSDYKRVQETLASGAQAWVYVAKQEATTSTVAANIAKIKARMAAACKHAGRDAHEVRLLLATKTVGPDRIKEAFRCGEHLIAENKVQEIKLKHEALRELPFEQHYIGHLQTNKVKEILRYGVHCIETLDRISLAEELHKRLSAENRTIEVLIQVNTSDEASKFGVPPAEAVDFVRQVAAFPTLRIKGLMTIGLFSSDHDKVRACFKRLSAIRQQVIASAIPGVEMKEMSMGMSGDLEIAIEEGATIIRVGTAIFGAREYPDSYYWDEDKAVK